MQGASLKGLVESLGAEGFYQKVCTLLNERTLTVDDFSYYELAEACGVLPQLSRMRGWQPDDAPAVVGQDDEDTQDAKRRSRNREEIDRGELRGMGGEKRAPRRRWRGASPVEIFRDCRSETSKPSLRKSPWMRGAPQSGLARRIWRMRSRRSVGIAGREGCINPDSFPEVLGARW